MILGLWDPRGDTATKVLWAGRMMRAHENAMENLVTFAPLVVAIHLTGVGTPVTAMASAVFFFSRLVHYLVFTFGVPLLRVVSFLTGFFAQMVLALALLGFV